MKQSVEKKNVNLETELLNESVHSHAEGEGGGARAGLESEGASERVGEDVSEAEARKEEERVGG